MRMLWVEAKNASDLMRLTKSAHHLKRAAERTHQSLSRTFNTLIDHCKGEAFDAHCHQAATSDLDPSDLNLFFQLQQHGTTSPSTYTLNKIISSCAKSTSLRTGTLVHAVAVKLGLSSNVYVSSPLINLYSKRGRMVDAHKVFDEMSDCNVVCWNSLISGYLTAGRPESSIHLFTEMLEKGPMPTPVTVSCILVGCSQLEAEDLGKQLHGFILKTGFFCNVVVGTGLVDMYSKCMKISDAKKIFTQMVEKNSFTWTCMVTGLVQSQQPDEAMLLMREMLQKGLIPNSVTYSSLLSSFDDSGYSICCKQVHCRVIQEGLESNQYVAVSLLSAYSQCNNNLTDFEELCSGIRWWDQIAWNAVIIGFTHLGEGKESLRLFHEMRIFGVGIDSFTYVAALKAARIDSAVKEGKKIHCLVSKAGHDISDIHIQNGLVAMYSSCGIMEDANRVFNSMIHHDIISWNSIIAGFAHQGFAEEAIEFFESMNRTSIKPNETTFLAVLTACSHAGLVEKGLEYFNTMLRPDSAGPPKTEHYATVVNLLGRAGNLQEAEAFVRSMPVGVAGPSVYKALLSSCRLHREKEMSVRAGKRLLEVYPNDPATYVLLSNVLQTGEDWVGAAELWELMSTRGIKKHPGCSWI